MSLPKFYPGYCHTNDFTRAPLQTKQEWILIIGREDIRMKALLYASTPHAVDEMKSVILQDFIKTSFNNEHIWPGVNHNVLAITDALLSLNTRPGRWPILHITIPQMIPLLCSYGFDINDGELELKTTILMTAAENGTRDVVEILLEHKADTTLRDSMGATALDYSTYTLCNGYMAHRSFLFNVSCMCAL